MIFLPMIQQHLNKICPTSYVDKFGKLLSLIFLTLAQNFSPCTMIHPSIHSPNNVSNVSCSPTVIDDIPELCLMMGLLELHCISLEFIRPAHILLSISIFMFPCRPNEDFLMAVRHFPMLYYMVGTINRYEINSSWMPLIRAIKLEIFLYDI